MAKLIALVLFLIAAFVAVSAASATAYTTEERCEREMEQQMPMRNCKMYMQSRMRGPYKEGFLRSAAANRRFEEERLQECCGELRQFSSKCRCDAVREMMMDMQQYGGMEEMQRMASSLPHMCGMSECQCHCKCEMSDCGCRCRRVSA